jgi:uncharacterized protein YutE (UPF0331/DUF86 family)
VTPSVRAAAILDRHAALTRAVARLRRHQAVTLEDYLADEDLQWIVERGLERAVGCVLDIGAHVLATLGQPVPDDYTAIIDQLASAGMLTGPFARSFRAMAGFRNVLVHAYLAIDPEVVLGVLHNHLDDFEAFDSQLLTALRDRGLLNG